MILRIGYMIKFQDSLIAYLVATVANQLVP